ncbi:subtilisin-like protein [Stipitochalara longipes BDJ]|nr:subtilisin-like protein [Stipitochalara longipes BDJ]
MFLQNFVAFLALSSTAFAFPATGKYARKDEQFATSVREKLAGPPPGWTRDEGVTLDKDTSTLSLRIHLINQDMDKFHELAMNIATPGHPLYGAHLSQEVINNFIAPKDESRDLVMQWLDREGLGKNSSISPRQDSIIVQASVSQIEKLLNAEYSPFVRTESGQSVVRTLEYSIPDVLKGHVDMVQPTTFFGMRSFRSTISDYHDIDDSLVTPEAAASCSPYVTPACLASLYEFSSATAYTNGLMGIAGFLEEYAIQSDLKLFMNKYATEGNKGETFSCVPVNGGSCTATNAGTEANLDVQYARAITESIPNVFYSTGGSPPWLGSGTNTNEPYLDFLDYLLALPAASLPNTISISYGDDESTVPLDYATNVCNLFSQLGARGVSVLVASGDSGVGSCSNGEAFFTTSFPAGCPWVTTVGGTTGTSTEEGWTDGGGGFSEVFGRPAYQNATVNNWLATDTTHSGVSQYFNHSGRAYPDVAAQATNFVIYVGGSAGGVDGTSCATPTFASVIQLLNSDRLASGKSGLGFLNPWLYSNATSGLKDITKGGNTGCNGVISGAGFSAVAGWDPATGLGTPLYTSLLTISRAT